MFAIRCMLVFAINRILVWNNGGTETVNYQETRLIGCTWTCTRRTFTEYVCWNVDRRNEPLKDKGRHLRALNESRCSIRTTEVRQ